MPKTGMSKENAYLTANNAWMERVHSCKEWVPLRTKGIGGGGQQRGEMKGGQEQLLPEISLAGSKKKGITEELD